MTTIFFTNQSTNVTSTVFNWPGGTGSFIVQSSNIDGATARLQMSPDQSTRFLDVGPDTTLTVQGIGNFHLNACRIRSILSTTGSSSNVSAQVR